MATDREQALAKLYGWDATIEDMFDLGEQHADFDEDAALEAYEEIIQVGAAVETAGIDALTLAVLLLAKHFYKFPHVHLNVVDAIAKLCGPKQPSVVRVHAAQSLLTIVKIANKGKDSLASASRDRIIQHANDSAKSEKSKVVEQQWAKLQKALGIPVTLDEKREVPLSKLEDKRDERAQGDKGQYSKSNDSRADRVQDRREGKRDEKPAEENRQQDSRRDSRSDSALSRDDRRRDSSTSANDRGNRDDVARDRRQSSGGKDPATNTNSQGCPPSPFIFIGGVPRDTVSRDIVNYLSCIDENINASCVQVKFPGGGRGSAGYAFVSLESTDHARRAIRHIHTTEFNGRSLIGDFARGPPCGTIQFVERNKDVARMHDPDSVRSVDFDKLDRSVWDDLRSELSRFGSLEPSGIGRARFRDIESAKSAIRHHHFNVRGYEFLAVYDLDEQMLLDSSRRSRQISRDEEPNRGGLSRYGSNSRSDSRDRRGNRASPDGGDRKRRRSPSPDNRDENPDKAPRNDVSGRRRELRRDFDQGRYGPRDSPAQPQRDNDRQRSRSPAPRSSDTRNARRSRSADRRAPDQAYTKTSSQEKRRSSSPAPRQAPSDRQRARSPSPRTERARRQNDDQRGPPRSAGRSRSPVRGSPVNPPHRDNQRRSSSPRRFNARDYSNGQANSRGSDRVESQRQKSFQRDVVADEREGRGTPPRGRPLDKRDENRRERSRSPNERQQNRDRNDQRNGNGRRSQSPRRNNGVAESRGRLRESDSNRGRDNTRSDTRPRDGDRVNRGDWGKQQKEQRSPRRSPLSPPPSRDGDDSNPRFKSPRRQFKSKASEAYDVDELMVDYEEDEE